MLWTSERRRRQLKVIELTLLFNNVNVAAKDYLEANTFPQQISDLFADK